MKKILVVCIIIGVILLAAGGVVLGLAIKNHQTVEPTETHTYTLEGDITNINVDVSIAKVKFVASEEGKKEVVCVDSEKRYHTAAVENGTLNIKYVDASKWYEGVFSFNSELSVTIYIPAGEYDTLRCEASTGSIEIPADFTFNSANIEVSTGAVLINSNIKGALNVTASTGAVYVKDLSAKSLNAKASTGAVRIENVTVEDGAVVETSTGKSEMSNLTAKSLNVNASTGNVTLSNTVIAEAIVIETSTGNVRFNDSDGASIKVTTDTGDVEGTVLTSKIFYAKSDTGRIDVPIGTSGGVFEIKTDTGDISLRIKA